VSLILSLFAWMPLVAVITSAVLLAVLCWAGDLEGRSLSVLLAWFLAAAGLQFLGRSGASNLAGLLLQTVLAVYLIVRWKIASL
jgi:uncharacterized membrane protein YfbV (UPF0208 family)